MNTAEYENELRMLEGNIVRLQISDNVEEIISMKNFAIARIENIASYREKQVSKHETMA